MKFDQVLHEFLDQCPFFRPICMKAARFTPDLGISAIRQAILKGSQLSPRDRDKLIEHLRQTDVLLSAAKQACQEILSSIADAPK